MAHIQDVSRSVSRELHHLVNQAQALVDATAGEQEARIKAARDALAERLESAKNEYHRVEGHFLDKVSAADAVVHAKPYYAMGGACLGGLLLGWLLARK